MDIYTKRELFLNAHEETKEFKQMYEEFHQISFDYKENFNLILAQLIHKYLVRTGKRREDFLIVSR